MDSRQVLAEYRKSLSFPCPARRGFLGAPPGFMYEVD
jgi:hypothetical protein